VATGWVFTLVQTDGLTCVNGEGHGFMLSRSVSGYFSVVTGRVLKRVPTRANEAVDRK
jgi:hypothetical protein